MARSSMESNADGSRLAVLDAAGTMTVYDLAARRPLFAAKDVTSMAFNASHAEVGWRECDAAVM